LVFLASLFDLAAQISGILLWAIELDYISANIQVFAFGFLGDFVNLPVGSDESASKR
jgi:hypothetical protein